MHGYNALNHAHSFPYYPLTTFDTGTYVQMYSPTFMHSKAMLTCHLQIALTIANVPDIDASIIDQNLHCALDGGGAGYPLRSDARSSRTGVTCQPFMDIPPLPPTVSRQVVEVR